jgi:ATP-binding cassette subfamily C protein LapB
MVNTVTETSLYSCLGLLLELQETNNSAEAVLQGLPVIDNHLSPRLFIRAAQRAGIKSTIKKKSLKSVLQQDLPAVILLEPESALLAINYDPTTQKLTVVEPKQKQETEIFVSEIKDRYIGYSITIQPADALDLMDMASEQKKSHRWFFSVLFKSLPVYRDVLVASFLINTFALATPLFIMNVYDRVVPNYALETLWVLVTGVLIIFGFDLLLRVLRGYFVDLAGKRVDLELSGKLYQHVLGIRMSSRPESVGAFANNLEEFESIRNFITSVTIITLIDIPFIVLFLLVIWYIGGSMVLVPVAIIPLILLYALILQPAIKSSVRRVMKGAAQKNATLVESLVGIETIKILGAESRQQTRWEQAVDHIARWGVRSRLLSASVVNFAVFLQQMGSIAVVVYGVYLIADGNLSLGGLIASVILTSRILAPMAQVANLATHYHQASSALKTISSIMLLPVEQENEKSYLQPNNIKGEIEFDSVSFSYPGQAKKALNNVSVKIGLGEHVGIIGRTGSGKSTLGKLIAGLYSENDGFVRIDGLDVRQINPKILRSNIAYVPQEVTLFSGTMRENIELGKENQVTDDQIIAAAELSGVMNIVKNHPSGFDMHIGERGAGLSGGQRQSVAIARAILNDANIVVMDEPSNSMDNATESFLKTKLRNYIDDKTFILITHKASMLELVNRLIVLEEGRVIADGPKEEVIAALQSSD